ncbi:uncharacterized protein NP_2640A [Natronomonas pharaonis DSM 2160]|uniref:Uncharacterized protein n=1 Tax=Natronomonas pharaonis (strain ATCC 35678 / DSM 2160 / CIP 103997 / JCM 8858 / NBRC 14720 / NCIMB 2260 / Gabara) TaxID=348780 RepID=A0A1U7EWF0_NATPD|nr:hypothetical protein [Natronomonas pharaonis]CAI49411.1 uncharacterized protein NP_2640A [Natronomonas pharaonis DSM 2160]
MPPDESGGATVRRYTTRALQLLGVGIAVAVPLLLVVAAVAAEEPGLGLLGAFLLAAAVVLYFSSRPRRPSVE